MLFRKKLYLAILAVLGATLIFFLLLRLFRPRENGNYWRINPKWEKIVSDEINQPRSIPQGDISVISFMKKYDVPGLSIAIAKDDKLIYTKGYGYADVTTEEKVNTTSLFRYVVCQSHLRLQPL